MHLRERDQPRRSLSLFLVMGARVQGCTGARCWVLVLVWSSIEIFCQPRARRLRSLCQPEARGELRFVYIATLVTIDQKIGNFLQ